jgi:protein involved in polysaccharide export with SLBB domain
MIVEKDPPNVASRIEFMAVVQEDFTVTLVSNQVSSTTGKTHEEFTREVHDYYVPRLFKNVNLMETDPPIYFVRGEVWSPGLRVLYRPTTVLGAAELAGGFTSSANRKRVEVRRFNRTGSPYTSYTSTHVVDCEKAQRDRAADLEVQRDDVIIVPRSLWKHWFHPGRDRSTNGWSQ